MLKKYKVILIIILSLLLLILFFNEQRDFQHSTVKHLNNFSIKDTAAINKIFIADRKGNTITLYKQENKWVINNKYVVRKDAMTTLLATINQIRIKRTIPKNAYNNVVKNLATTGVKVEIYTDDYQPIRIYTVGGNTPDHLGTYMLLEGAEIPYIVHIPIFQGFLSPRYGIQGGILSEKDWRDNTVFNIQSTQIKAITFIDKDNPKKSYYLDAVHQELFDHNKSKVAFKQLKIIQLLNSFEQLNCESFKEEKHKLIIAKPLHTLIVSHHEHIDTLRTFATRDKKNIKKKDNYTVERMYATLNDGELMLIQEYVFNKVLITIDDLQD